MLNVTYRYINAIKKESKYQMLAKLWSQRNSHSLWVGMHSLVVTYEVKNIELPQFHQSHP